MSKEIKNITLPIVLEEIDLFSESHAYYSYHNLLADSDFRQELIVYILNQIPNFFTIVEEGQVANYSENFNKSLEQRMTIEALIHNKIQQTILENTLIQMLPDN